MTNHLLPISDVIPDSDGIEYSEANSDFAGKCLHCNNFIPSSKRADVGQCIRTMQAVHGNETCPRQHPEKPKENPWSPDAGYFDFNIVRAPKTVLWATKGLSILVSKGITHRDAREKYRVGMKNENIVITEVLNAGINLRIRCDCGEEKIIRSRKFFTTKSCGCKTDKARGEKNIAAAIGKTFGNLKLMRTADEFKGIVRHKMVICRCLICGKEKEYDWQNVKSGRSTQCPDCAAKTRNAAKRREYNALIGKPFGASEDYIICETVLRQRNVTKNGKSTQSSRTWLRIVCRHCGHERVVLNSKQNKPLSCSKHTKPTNAKQGKICG